MPSPAMRRFWTMLAHCNGQTWNSSELPRSMWTSDKTVRSCLDVLTGTYMIRQPQPWHENVGKRQVNPPKICFRDTGLLHSLLALPDRHPLIGHARVGASWEGFAVEQVIQVVRPGEAFFWATHQGAGIDLFFRHAGRRFAVEAKYSEAPRVTKPVRVALENLHLRHLWVAYPGDKEYNVGDNISVIPLSAITRLRDQIEQLAQ